MEKAKKQLEEDEGKRLFPYVDTVGKLTIGIGRNIEDIGLNEAEVQFMFNNDIARVRNELIKTFDWFLFLSEARQWVLINMGFMGVPKLKKFVKTISLIENGEYEKASKEMLKSKWAVQVGDRAKRLSKVMKNGKW